PIQPDFLAHVRAGLLECPPGRSRHGLDAEVFDDDESVRRGERMRGLVGEVHAAVTDRLEDSPDRAYGATSTVGTLLLAGEAALQVPQAVLVASAHANKREASAIAGGDRDHHPAVDAHWWLAVRRDL